MEPRPVKPSIVLVVGMAGTGKTTLVQRLHLFSEEHHLRSYFINLDPACIGDTPFGCNIDIRDVVNYKEVMAQYRLGPNGAIMTSLNLYATKIHQAIAIVESKGSSIDYVFIDTPGQIEVFTWSASGQLIIEAFSSTFPTFIVFVGDTSRCMNPQTFVSTIMYASSIMYKTQLPIVVALNKCDAVRGDLIVQWLRDSDILMAALREQKGYASTLGHSLAIFVHEFYENLRCSCVSAITGQGIDQLLRSDFVAARKEYEESFGPLVASKHEARQAAEAANMQKQLQRLDADMKETK